MNVKPNPSAEWKPVPVKADRWLSFVLFPCWVATSHEEKEATKGSGGSKHDNLFVSAKHSLVWSREGWSRRKKAKERVGRRKEEEMRSRWWTEMDSKRSRCKKKSKLWEKDMFDEITKKRSSDRLTDMKTYQTWKLCQHERTLCFIHTALIALFR